ncbi:EF-P 5-aminopentanol modification-associated protein YfmH [Enterococcus sp. CWB-B31]|uniref:EF-P 5-aminopentanol modification-associated protein YfmH n=1 Tax=Enterococcus sp. CWB-B31 TaxID=2885159 RepID=UPI001E33FDC4|nr:pitrilysin family protein [Enterococcus sp. CWB-B31]MCB5954858.1 insulinase family protein [Enterococcus sp. CWB-B31]
MDKKVYPQINEVLYTERLDNGLTVYLLPKNDYHKTYGLFTTNYGSIDNEFVPLGENKFTRVPDGIAHFLEHKMFEKETGDVFQDFGRQGASANAFTSFTKTSYLFSTTDQVKKNLETLLDFVQEPYFTEETVEKEKGIIGQEIQMYQDDPNWRLFFGILGNLYPKHPLHIDIAGTVESIDKITAEDLYTCYHTFYHPSNMTLFIVGKMNPDEMMSFIRANQGKKSFAKAVPIKRHFPQETAADIVRESSIEMPIQRTKILVGLKGLEDLPTDGLQLIKYKTSVNLLLQLLFGNTSKNYLSLYNEGLLDDSFSYEFNLDRSFHFADIGGDSDRPDELAEAIEKILLTYGESAELTEENLNLLKKKMIGKYFQSLNSLEYIANQFSQSLFGDVTLFDMLSVIDQIQMSDIKEAAETFIREDGLSRFYIYPKEQ